MHKKITRLAGVAAQFCMGWQIGGHAWVAHGITSQHAC